MEPAWEFWIDVGGTFTDCIGRPTQGETCRLKTLSSGVVKGTATRIDRQSLYDSARTGDPVDFWKDWQLRCLNSDGVVLCERKVIRSSPESGQLVVNKPLSDVTAPMAYELFANLDGPTVAMRRLTKSPLSQPMPPLTIRLGTTRGTNALLTRQGARTAWVTTAGFGDLLEIGYQSRPDLFALDIRKPHPLYETVLEVEERVRADGTISRTPNLTRVRDELQQLRDRGIEAIAIGFLHGYAYPQHEQAVATVARHLGFADVSVSHEVAPLIKLVARGDTTVANAYLNPALRDYLSKLHSAVSTDSVHRLRLMTSAGGLVAPEAFEGKDSILSGPAGGVVGAARVAAAVSRPRVIGFDMGGTSTDVSRFDGQFDYEYETEKAGVRLVAPMLSIETVAAGGGSICHFDGIRLCVGPQSAGADPGPACYGRGGPLTVTDLNLFLGRLPSDALPFPLHQTSVHRRLTEIQRELRDTGIEYTLEALAAGFLRVANHNMAQAIRSVSLAKGYDPREYALVAFGGAAPQHACAVARELQIPEVIDPPDGALLSAVGIGLADETGHAQQGIYRLLEACQNELESRYSELEHQADARVPSADWSARKKSEHQQTRVVTRTRSIELRYQGTEWPISLDVDDLTNLAHDYHAAHRRLYGYDQPDRPIEVVALRTETQRHPDWSLPESHSVPSRRDAEHRLQTSDARQTMHVNGRSVDVPRHERASLVPGDRIAGPAVIVQSTATTVVDDGWIAEVLSEGELLLRDTSSAQRESISVEYDPIALELFNGQFEAIAEQMGITLRNTSSSVNVKERLDFSCAVFTAAGDLVVNAPHIPVHLGAMSQTVRCVIDDNPSLQVGDVVVTNDPFRGGSHLPDVTVVTPIFDAGGKQLRFFVASRAHHAEIGGVTPGSMPPFSTNLSEEGVLIRNFKLVSAGRSNIDQFRSLLESAPFPSRDVSANIADVNAQVAANQQGVRDLQEMIERYSWPTVRAYMQHIQRAAEKKTRNALAPLAKRKQLRFSDQLDSGEPIVVTIDVTGDEAVIDFSGSAGVHPNNLNANEAIVRAATMYVLRCLINEPLPLNEGVLAPIKLVVPSGLLNPPGSSDPTKCPAVAGGNVETSQRIVDVMLGAIGLVAASQGTMNNLLFGNQRFGYYETICGGAGATPHGAGASAVHTHMTNTRLTDVEVLENKFPIRVVRFAIRRQSGGAGLFPGGDGVIREIEFLEPLALSILSQRRGPYAPFGLAGGQPGKLGENQLVRQDGSTLQLGGRVQQQVSVGDRLVIKTPGGGGYGKAN